MFAAKNTMTIKQLMLSSFRSMRNEEKIRMNS